MSEWYVYAAHRGEIHGQLNLAAAYLQGIGPCERDIGKAIEWYEKAAEQGSLRAQTKLGDILSSQKLGVRDCERALYWYKRAAETDDPHAHLTLGQIFGNGILTDMDKDLSAYHLNQAARSTQIDIRTLESIGMRFLKGKGVDANPTIAARCLMRPANKGLSYAQFYLAELYLTGKGVPKDIVEAHKWFNLSASDHNSYMSKTAARKRDRLEAQMKDDEVTEAQRRAGELFRNLKREL